jgi:CubicO group peptidase (beta-lactamase class C family)
LTVATGFELVAEEFERNFGERGELGAAFAVHHRGELVVDLWGGVADRESGRPWERDTLQLIFSGSKGLVAVCLLLLIDRGQLDLEAEVRTYWPEFAAAGKGEVRVRELVSHTDCLPGLTAPLAVADLTDGAWLATLLAAQPQLDDPRARQVYHPLSFGWLCGELVRRIDGRSLGRFFAEEVAAPLGLELFIGLPAALEPRVSRLELAPTWGQLAAFEPGAGADDELMRVVFANPAVWTRETFPWNRPAFHQAEIPAVGAIGTARSIATLYGSLGQLLSPRALALGTTELERRRDPLVDEPQRFGVGFQLQNELLELGPPADAFGHSGAGGSVHGCWPGAGLGFSYAMNLMRDDSPGGDPRAAALLDALAQCLGGTIALGQL